MNGCRFLQIHHIEGGGSKQTRELKKNGSFGKTIYHFLKRNDYPEGYGILDGGCNAAMEPGETVCETHKWNINHEQQSIGTISQPFNNRKSKENTSQSYKKNKSLHCSYNLLSYKYR